jgi:hypothetical protein
LPFRTICFAALIHQQENRLPTKSQSLPTTMPSYKDDRPASRQPKRQFKPKADPKANIKAKANPDHEYRYQSYSDSDDDHTDYSYRDSDAPSDNHTDLNEYVGERQRHARVGRTRASFDAGRRFAAQSTNSSSVIGGIFRNIPLLALLFVLFILLSNSRDWCHDYEPARLFSKQVAKLGVGDFCVADNNFGRKDSPPNRAGRYTNAYQTQAASRPPKIMPTSYSGQAAGIPLNSGKCKLVLFQSRSTYTLPGTPLVGNATSAAIACLDLAPGVASVHELSRSFVIGVFTIKSFFNQRGEHYKNPSVAIGANKDLLNTQSLLQRTSSSFRKDETFRRSAFAHGVEALATVAETFWWSATETFFNDYVKFLDNQLSMISILLGSGNDLIQKLQDFSDGVEYPQEAFERGYHCSVKAAECEAPPPADSEGWVQHLSIALPDGSPVSAFCFPSASDLDAFFGPMRDLASWQMNHVVLVRKEYANLAQHLRALRAASPEAMGGRVKDHTWLLDTREFLTSTRKDMRARKAEDLAMDKKVLKVHEVSKLRRETLEQYAREQTASKLAGVKAKPTSIYS